MSEKPQTSEKQTELWNFREISFRMEYIKGGTDIPAGVLDFHHVCGNGYLQVYKAEETILGNLIVSMSKSKEIDIDL